MRFPRPAVGQVEDLKQGLPHCSDPAPSPLSERPTNQAAVVDRTLLLDQNVRTAAQISRRRNPDPKRLGLIHQGSRKRSYERRRIAPVALACCTLTRCETSLALSESREAVQDLQMSIRRQAAPKEVRRCLSQPSQGEFGPTRDQSASSRSVSRTPRPAIPRTARGLGG